MTEKEKMLAGEFYNTRDPEIIKRRYLSRHLQDIFNSLPSDAIDERNACLKKLLRHVGKDVWIEKPFKCNYGENITIGDSTFINFNCVLSDDCKIEIGKNVMLAPGVQIYNSTHPIPVKERVKSNQDGTEKSQAPFRTYAKPVTIGDGAWIGGCAIILPGIHIGKGTVIGAGSVVTNDIPDNVVAVGNPCRILHTIPENKE